MAGGTTLLFLLGRASSSENLSTLAPFTVLPFVAGMTNGSSGGSIGGSILIGAIPGVTALSAVLFAERSGARSDELTLPGGIALMGVFGMLGLAASLVGHVIGLPIRILFS